MDVSSDDLPVISVMPVMTLQEIEDMDEDDDSSYEDSMSDRDSSNDVRDPFPRNNSPSYRLRTSPRLFEDIKTNSNNLIRRTKNERKELFIK